jgi:hypothetical protein
VAIDHEAARPAARPISAFREWLMAQARGDIAAAN